MLFPSALPTRVPDPGNNGCRSLYAAAACVHFRPVDDQPLPQRCKRIHCSIGQSRSCPGVRANIPSSILAAENGFQRDESGGIRAVPRAIGVWMQDEPWPATGTCRANSALRSAGLRRIVPDTWGVSSAPPRPCSRESGGRPDRETRRIPRSSLQMGWILARMYPGYATARHSLLREPGRAP